MTLCEQYYEGDAVQACCEGCKQVHCPRVIDVLFASPKGGSVEETNSTLTNSRGRDFHPKVSSDSNSNRFSYLFTLIVALLLSGCGSYAPTQATTETDNQRYALEQAHYFAKVKGIRLDAVRFSDQYPDYLAWAECYEHVITFNRTHLEEAWIRDFIPAIAAHEVCHIYYKDNLPCGQRPQVDVEARAEACARAML